MKSDISRPRSSSSSSQSDKDRGEYRAVTKPQTEARQTEAVPRQKAQTIKSKARTPPAPQLYPQTPRASNGGALSQPKNYESVPVVKSSRKLNQTTPAQTGRNESREITEKIGKRSRKISGTANREQKGRERDEGEHGHDEDEDEEEDDEGEEEWSAEAYWRASYRAWNDYYASMSPFKEHGYQNYYSVAHNWMAAYRMNTVYMEELLKH
ncbi:putative ATP-dependent RNA helicase DDX20 [Nibea albiflora]|uniref:ATP-dependent RNA helicase DDX20 n=1 Tax=Nibea albiflora TaxID=240163 RepID=A0ACB7EL92_NIBAL|nr:putative ATP-dependent RNA helicase DDX20 [Nibea albiflora]